MKDANPLKALLNKENKPANDDQSIMSHRSGNNNDYSLEAKHINNKGIKKVIKKQFDCLQEIRKDIKEIKSRKLKDDKKQVLSKVKELEKILAKNEEKQKFDQFKMDLLMVV